jgi:hypothetical protein
MTNSKSTLRVAEREPVVGGQAPAAPIGADIFQELKVSGHLMSLPAGLFCILHEPAVASGVQAGLPAIRISLPPSGAAGVEITSFRPDGWLGAGGDAALVRVAQGPAQILATIYQLQNAPDAGPKLQVRQLIGGVDSASSAIPAGTAAAPQKMDFMAHVQGNGDRGAKFGAWVGELGSGNWIEGFAIAVPEGFGPSDLSYQAVLGRGWLSPWVEAGQYCGSRGMALPLLGFRIRLQGAAAEAFDLSATASFVDGSECGPVGSDETCEGEKLAPLEAMTVRLIPRARRPTRAKR